MLVKAVTRFVVLVSAVGRSVSLFEWFCQLDRSSRIDCFATDDASTSSGPFVLRRGIATSQVLAVCGISEGSRAIPRLVSLDGCLECPCSGLCGAAMSRIWLVRSKRD